MFMSPKHAENLGRSAYYSGANNPFPFGITYHHDQVFGYNAEDTMEEWYAEDYDNEGEEDWEANYLDWENEPDEIDANDSIIPDKRTNYCEGL